MISIIIPYYFGEKVVKRSLLSCAPGREIDAQIILAFDSPENEAATQIKKWAQERAGNELPEVIILQNEENIGPAATRRVALEKADRSYVILCDQDDELTPIRFQSNAFYGYDLTLYETVRIGPSNEFHETHPHRLKRIDMFNSPAWNQILATRRQPARIGEVTMKRDLADHALSRRDGGGEEWEFFVSALKVNPKIHYDSRIGMRRHVHDQNLSILRRQRRLESWLDRVEAIDIPPIVRFIAKRTIRKRIREAPK